jgi:hypothetical protein
MFVDDDPVLVKPMGRNVGKALLDTDGDKTYVVCVAQYDERGAGSTTRRRACRLNKKRVGRGWCRLHHSSRAVRC